MSTTSTNLRFDGRVAIVTGGAQGMGREHSVLLGSRGAKIVVNDLTRKALKRQSRLFKPEEVKRSLSPGPFRSELSSRLLSMLRSTPGVGSTS